MLTYRVFTFNPFAENTYILVNSASEAIILDPGCHFPEEKEMLAEYLKSNNLKPIQLINTHCHLDHVFGNKWAFETYGLELFLHPMEKIVLQYADIAGQKWGVPFENYTGPLHFINEGDTLYFGDEELKVLLTPGHSPGSICLYSEKEKLLFGGDVLFRQSIGRTDLPGGDHETLLKSIREQLFVLPEDVTVLSGHGEPTTIGYEKYNNPYLR